MILALIIVSSGLAVVMAEAPAEAAQELAPLVPSMSCTSPCSRER